MDLLTANDRPGTYPDSWYAASADMLPPFPAATSILASSTNFMMDIGLPGLVDPATPRWSGQCRCQGRNCKDL